MVRGFELAWKTLRDYLARVAVEAEFPRAVIKKGFQYDMIEDGDLWIHMLEQRHLIAHTYDEENAKTAYERITTAYYQQLEALWLSLEQKSKDG